ncbi:MAG: hypothetical protein LBC88_06920 [Spirochaetaceae bacterium]|nr:hypothetical protein [Spirochaetaceae bacterium]
MPVFPRPIFWLTANHIGRQSPLAKPEHAAVGFASGSLYNYKGKIGIKPLFPKQFQPPVLKLTPAFGKPAFMRGPAFTPNCA